MCTILLIGITIYLAPSIIPSARPVHASSKTISLVGNTSPSYYWNSSNPTITVTQGDTLTIAVSSANAVQHKLLIDLDNDTYTDTTDCGTLDMCSGVVPPSNPVGPFTVSSNPGTYKYYCIFHPGSMVGNFVIQSQTPSTPEFSVTPSTSSLTVVQGASSTATITLTSLNGFSGSISLSAATLPSGPQLSLSPSSVSLSSGGSASSTLTVSTSPSGYYASPVSPGSYTLNVTASSGSLSHSATLTLSVTSSGSAPSGNSSLPVLPIVGGIIGAIAVVGVAVLLFRRKPKS
jgi:plastocyanin